MCLLLKLLSLWEMCMKYHIYIYILLPHKRCVGKRVLQYNSIAALLEPLCLNKQQHKRKNVFEQHKKKNYSLLLFYSEAIWSILEATYNVSCI